MAKPAWNGLRECRECEPVVNGEGHVGIEVLEHIDVGPRVGETACQEGMCSESSEPLAGRLGAPHSEGIAYKPPCGEIAMCREWADGADK